jgi:hypothetical protein
MSYTCIPHWQQPTNNDPFDYKLRSKKEIIDEFKYLPAEFLVMGAYKKYSAGETRPEDNLDNRERVVSLTFDN